MSYPLILINFYSDTYLAIVEKFPIELSIDYGKNKRRIPSSEDWTHVDDQHTTIEINDEPRQALSRLATIAKRAAIIAVNNNEAENRPLSLFNESEFRQICENNCLRASFRNRFAQLVSQMDAFM
ncbi:unnamed protein product [Rotaria socialis]|uniref:Uncharacterized protein n=1 Tax=Rotaria socialis TaxID=392032 RepID=A0A818J9A7_9BILA|nr:unnamed protein product [Rotaria socialis]